MLRKVLLFGLCVIMVCTAAACHNIGNVIGEKIVETVLGKSIDINGSRVTVTHEDGGKYVFGNGEWPKVVIAKLIPEFEAGTVKQTFYTPKSCVITINNVEEAFFNEYIVKVRRAGFKYAQNRDEGDFERGFYGENLVGCGLRLNYHTDSETLYIALFIGKKAENLTTGENNI